MKNLHIISNSSVIKPQDYLIVYYNSESNVSSIIIKKPKIGDIMVYVEETNEHKYISPSDFTGNEGTPIGIVVIPEYISPSGKNVCISLANMDASNAKEGSADNLFEGDKPEVTGLYTSYKGDTTANLKVTQSDGYLLTTFTDWYGRSGTNYATKRIIDFENNLIGDVLLDRYQITGQKRQNFIPSRSQSLSKKYTTFPVVGKDSNSILVSGPSASESNVKGYVPQYFYNPEYTLDNGTHFEGGFQDKTFPTHYWYTGCTENSTQKLRIPSPINTKMKFNTLWSGEGSMTSDFDGKRNTMELVNDALAGVANSNGELIKWDGTPESLWKPYKVTAPASDCTNGYDETGKIWKNTNYTQATSPIEWYYFPSTFNGGGSLMNYWNYAALTCHCYAPSGSGTNPGDWYCPASGELAFALAFAKEINDSIDLLKSKGYNAVGISRLVASENGTDIFSYTYANNPYFIGNELNCQVLLSSTAFSDIEMIDMYVGHASFFGRKPTSPSSASKTRAFIQI